LIERLKRILLDKYLDWRLKRRSSPQRMYDFGENLKKIRHILLVIPEHTNIEDLISGFMQKLYEIFTRDVIISTFEKKTFRAEDSTWLGLPKKEYLETFQSEKIDLVIDLNQNEDKFCTYVCAILNAPLKINLESGRFDHIYNLHIRTNESKTLDQKLETLVRYLRNLTQIPTKSIS